MSKNDRPRALSRLAEAINLPIRDGEEGPRMWCHDVALGCTCEPEMKFSSVYVIPVVRGKAGDVDYDRCLGCGATWLARDYRWQPSQALEIA